jgi:hypothetical protein
VLSGDTEAQPDTYPDHGSLTQGAGTAHKSDTEKKTVHFFPLPFNQEQGRISDLIDDPKFSVVCVSGPPGTGKSHSIANIISHQMALGKRVLVTARTPEAIAAVREKLPESLRPLAIASVGTDRESAQQLQDAVKELSNEVVNLNTDDALARWKDLDRQIMECDEIARKTDEALAQIARANLDQLDWNGARPTPMELVDLLGEAEEAHAWFTDRPTFQPSAQLSEVIDRLKIIFPSLAADIVYAGAVLPAPSELPSTTELIAAHTAELQWNTREIVDYAGAPRMARDSAGAEVQAGRILTELEALNVFIDMQPVAVRSLAGHALESSSLINHSAVEATRRYLSKFDGLERIFDVTYDLGNCSQADFVSAVTRGTSGQKPVGFGLFNGRLKTAVGSARVRGKLPATSEDWKSVLDACRLESGKRYITDFLKHFICDKTMPPVPFQASKLPSFQDREIPS